MEKCFSEILCFPSRFCHFSIHVNPRQLFCSKRPGLTNRTNKEEANNSLSLGITTILLLVLHFLLLLLLLSHHLRHPHQSSLLFMNRVLDAFIKQIPIFLEFNQYEPSIREIVSLQSNCTSSKYSTLIQCPQLTN